MRQHQLKGLDETFGVRAVFDRVSKVIRQLFCFWFYYGLRLAEYANW